MVAKQGDGKLVTLQAGTVNAVKVHGMSFLITASNGGDFTEYNIPVKLTIGTGANQVTKTATIPQITEGPEEDGHDRRLRVDHAAVRQGGAAEGSGDAGAR